MGCIINLVAEGPWMDPYQVSIIITAGVMLSASVSDLRSREVSDTHWWLIMLSALPFLFITCSAGQFLQIISAAMIVSALVLGGGRIAVCCGILSVPVWIAGFVCGGCMISCHSFSALAVMMFFALYRTGLIAGGADVKCLMAISVAFPEYIVHDAGLLAQLFPPSLSVLMLSVLLTFIVGGIWLIWKNRHGSLKDLPCFRMSLDEARHSFVWPMEDFRSGRVVRIKTPDYESIPGILERLRDNEVESVLVTPMFPFIVPLTASFMIVALFGNPLVLI